MTKIETKSCAFNCGRPAHQGKRLCKSHLEHQRNKMAEYRVKRKEAGLCSRCPNPARTMADGSASTLCERCRARVRTLEQLESSKQVRLTRSIVRAKATGWTLREIAVQKGLPVERVRQLLAQASKA